jgi:hypothetical protein
MLKYFSAEVILTLYIVIFHFDICIFNFLATKTDFDFCLLFVFLFFYIIPR